MQAERASFSRAAFLVAGLAVGAASRVFVDSRRAAEIATLKRSLAEAEGRFADRQAAWDDTLARIEQRLDAHEGKLNDMPSAAQIVSAMDELLSKTMQSLNQRLTTQADSIDLLKTTVAQTDGLLERVLESLDALRQAPDSHAEASPTPK